MKEEKTRFPFYVRNSTMDVVKETYRQDSCKSQSEFIEKAILFYAGYLHTKQAANYLPRVLSDILISGFGSFGDRMGKLMFKQAVEANILNHIIAADSDMDWDTYERLRIRSLREVQQTNGEISFGNDLIFQKEL